MQKILIYPIGYVTVKDLSCATTNSVKPLYLAINKTNWYIEESNGNKYLAQVPTDESRDYKKILRTMEQNQISH